MALFWTRRAAKENEPLGVYNLGISYLEGLGMPKNREKAILNLQKAIELGNDKAKEVLDKILTEDDKEWLRERENGDADEEKEVDENVDENIDETENTDSDDDVDSEEKTEKPAKKGFFAKLKSHLIGE